MNTITKNDLLNLFEPTYKLKIISNLYRNINITILKCIWNKIKKDKFILECSLEKISDRYDNSSAIIEFLKHFKKDYPIYVYINEKMVILPIKNIEKDRDKKTIYLYID